MTGIPVLGSISTLARSFDVWFADIWGVLHDGVRPYARAVEACREFRQAGGTVILLSNAPRPCQSVIDQLNRIGVEREAHDTVVSSGDLSRALIAKWSGRTMLHIGPERDKPLFEGLDVAITGVPRSADAAVCTGLYDDEGETPEDYATLLQTLKSRDVPMICANPDLQVVRGGRVIYCAGAIAAVYDRLGGKVDYAGKPYLPIYDFAVVTAAKLRGAKITKSRILAIGDGVATDIAGAGAFGIASVFIASGLHHRPGEDLATTADRLFAPASTVRPVALMSDLAW